MIYNMKKINLENIFFVSFLKLSIMKKYLFLSAVAATMLCACSNDSDEVVSMNDNQNAENGLVPVELSVKAPVKIITRGTGTVGDLEANVDNNVWRGETLYFNMFEKKTDAGEDVLKWSEWELIEGDNNSSQVVNFDNIPLSVTSDGISNVANVEWVDSKYYPQDKSRHDFFAYRIDDAATNLNGEGKPELEEVDLKRYVSFTIDGTQDLMVGQADPEPEDVDYAYSAKSAREGIIPQIDMKHLLSRFTFAVKAGHSNANGLKVNKIEVVSKVSGKMLVAWHPTEAPATAEEMISWDDSDTNTALLTLMQRPKDGTGEYLYNTQLETMEDATLNWDATDGAVQVEQAVGEALMVSPGQEEYDVFITTTQEMRDGRLNTITTPSKINVASTNGGPAIAGTSYKVVITLYGQSEIQLTTSLTGWNSGVDIPVDTAQ